MVFVVFCVLGCILIISRRLNGRTAEAPETIPQIGPRANKRREALQFFLVLRKSTPHASPGEGLKRAKVEGSRVGIK